MKCPKCGVEIKRFDLAPNCKECGCNLMYYTQTEDLTLDAKRAELDFAKARAVVARVKATYIGSTVAKIRLASGVLSVAALVVPFLALSLNLPLVSWELKTGIIGIIGVFRNGVLGMISDFLACGVEGPLVKAVLVHCVFFVLTAFFELCMFITYLLASINVKRGTKAELVFSVCAFLMNAGAVISVFIAKADVAGSSSISVSTGFGGYVIAAILAVFIAANVIMLRHEPVVEVSDVDKKRIEIREQVKAGKISYDELTLPVFETEEEKEKRKNLFGIVEEMNMNEEGAD